MTNKELIEAYPWLIPTNRWSGKRITDCTGPDGEEGYWPGNPSAHPEYNYDYTELDEMPQGWRRAFGEDLCAELNEEIKTWPREAQDKFRIVQIKEKWGFLHFYTNYSSGRFKKILGKYITTSRATCINCGKSARWITRGWYMPVCDKCAREAYDNNTWKPDFKFEDEYMDIDEYYKKED